MLVSSAVWMASSFFVHSLAGRLLGPKDYGTFGIIYALISTSYIILGAGVKKAVTKYVASDPERAGDIRAAGLRVQLIICIIIVLILLLVSRPMGIWLNDSHMNYLIRYSACVVPVAGFLYVYIGYFDGCRQFGKSALVTITHSVIKVIFVFLFLYLGYEIFGAISGLLIGLGGGLAFAVFQGRNAPKAKKFDHKVIVQFALPVLSVFICVSILSYLDLFFVKAMLDDPAKTGYYTAAQTISKLVSFAMFPFGIILFPSISSAIAKNDLNLVRKYIQESLRYILIILIPGCMLLSITAGQIIFYVYGRVYTPGAISLSILFFGASCWGITNAMVAIIQGYGQPGKTALIFGIMIPVDLIFMQIFIRQFGVEGAAIATTATFVFGMIFAGITIYNKYEVLIKTGTVIRLLGASSMACLPLVLIRPQGILWLFLSYCGSMGAYLLILYISGELKKEDMALLVDSIKRRKPLEAV